MKKVLSLFLSVVMLFSMTAGTDFSASAANKTISITTNVIENYDYANSVVSKINNERSKKGKSKLKIDSTLTSYAMQRAAELACKYSHTRPNGSDCLSIGKKANGENIQAGAVSATEVMSIWMNSKGHKENILRNSFKSVGVGCVKINGYYFWVQLFSKSSGNGEKTTGTKYKNRNINVTKKNLYFYINTYDLASNSYNYGNELDLYYDGIDYEMIPNGYQIQVNAVDMSNDFYSGVTDAIVDKSMFSYSSSNSNIFTVSSSGVVNIKKTGTATLTITLKKDSNFKIKQKVSVRRNSTIKISKSSYVYDGKTHNPKISIYDINNEIQTNYTYKYKTNCKNVGTHIIEISYDNFEYPIRYTFKIIPKNTSISSVTAGSKRFTVKWYKRTTQTTGYQVQYSTSSKFTSPKTITISKTGTTSKTVKKLKAKKRYYVRVRTYKTVNGTRYYSSWSKYKKVTTKS